MVSETAALSSDDAGAAVKRSVSSKKNHRKAPRKIVKAEREKSKRDHMNVLFLELEKVIEPAQQNSGKASMLNDTIRLLKELLAQIDCLKKENSSLLSESHYVTGEKNELKEENVALEAQIGKLQSEIEARSQTQSPPNSSFSQPQPPYAQPLSELPLRLPSVDHSSYDSYPAPVLGPVYVLPLHQEPQTYPTPDTAEAVLKVPLNVSRPRPRYPSQSDSWPSNILARQANMCEDN